MAIFVFVLGLLLTILGFGGLVASVDLLPTEVGILYAGCGTIAASSGLIVISIGALIRRVDALGGTFSLSSPEPTPFETLALEPDPLHASEPTDPLDASKPTPERSAAIGEERVEDEPINENRAGRLPTLAEVEHVISEPGVAPTLVGRYTAGGAPHMIFSDG